MAEVKTGPTGVDPESFLSSVEPERRRREGFELLALYRRVTGEPAVMWGPSIVGFGSYDYVYATGHSGRATAAGFSPRRAQLTLYFADGFDHYVDELGRLGPHTSSRSCLYIKRLEAVDHAVLESMVRSSFGRMNGLQYRG